MSGRRVGAALAVLLVACQPEPPALPDVQSTAPTPVTLGALQPVEGPLRDASRPQLEAALQGTALEQTVAAYLLRDDEAYAEGLARLQAEAPEAPVTQLFLALQLRMANQLTDALTLLRPIARDATDPWILYHIAATYQDAGLYVEAVRYAEAAQAQAAPDRPMYEAASLQATALRYLQRYDEARDVAEQALEQTEAAEASTLSARFQLGRLYGELGDFPRAQAELEACETEAAALLSGAVTAPIGVGRPAIAYLAGKVETYLGLIALVTEAPAETAIAHFARSRALLSEASPDGPLVATEAMTHALALALWHQPQASQAILEEVPSLIFTPSDEIQLRTVAFNGDWDFVFARTQNIEDTHAGGSPFDASRLRTLLVDAPCPDAPAPFAGCDAALASITAPMSCLMRGGDYEALVLRAGEALRCEGRTDSERTVFTWYATLGADMEEQRAALRDQLLHFASGS